MPLADRPARRIGRDSRSVDALPDLDNNEEKRVQQIQENMLNSSLGPEGIKWYSITCICSTCIVWSLHVSNHNANLEVAYLQGRNLFAEEKLDTNLVFQSNC